jgi:hypothetical protein
MSGAHNSGIPNVDQVDSTSVQTIDKDAEKLPVNATAEAQFVTTNGNVISKDGVVYTNHVHGSDTSDSDNIFSDPEIRDFYKNLYEDAKYECRHLFDPDATWTKEEERRVIRKLDARGKS